MTTLRQNTDKEYPCTMCGSLGNIIKEDPNNPRLKCNECGFMYDGKDSISAKEAGLIPDGPPEIEDPLEIPPPSTLPLVGATGVVKDRTRRLPLWVALPRSPTHVLLTKDRKDFEFVTKRTLRKEVLKWTAAGRNFDLFELNLKKVDAKIQID